MRWIVLSADQIVFFTRALRSGGGRGIVRDVAVTATGGVDGDSVVFGFARDVDIFVVPECAVLRDFG